MPVIWACGLAAASVINKCRDLGVLPPPERVRHRRPSPAVLSVKNADAEHRLWWGSRDDARASTVARLFDPHPTASHSEAVDLPPLQGEVWSSRRVHEPCHTLRLSRALSRPTGGARSPVIAVSFSRDARQHGSKRLEQGGVIGAGPFAHRVRERRIVLWAGFPAIPKIDSVDQNRVPSGTVGQLKTTRSG